MKGQGFLALHDLDSFTSHYFERSSIIRARDKLNQIHSERILVMAIVAGLCCQSWLVFFAAIVVLGAGDLATGNIRPNARP